MNKPLPPDWLLNDDDDRLWWLPPACAALAPPVDVVVAPFVLARYDADPTKGRGLTVERPGWVTPLAAAAALLALLGLLVAVVVVVAPEMSTSVVARGLLVRRPLIPAGFG